MNCAMTACGGNRPVRFVCASRVTGHSFRFRRSAASRPNIGRPASNRANPKAVDQPHGGYEGDYIHARLERLHARVDPTRFLVAPQTSG